MTRLFAGTPFDRPPRCERCGELEEDCVCPPAPHSWRPPDQQTARVRVEKRKAGRVVTMVEGLDPQESDLPALLKALKNLCGAGGSLREDQIELQGEQATRVVAHLRGLGYRVR